MTSKTNEAMISPEAAARIDQLLANLELAYENIDAITTWLQETKAEAGAYSAYMSEAGIEDHTRPQLQQLRTQRLAIEGIMAELAELDPANFGDEAEAPAAQDPSAAAGYAAELAALPF